MGSATCVKHVACCDDIVALECTWRSTGDLRMQLDDTGRIDERGLPFTRFGEVGLNRDHLGMQPTQNAEIVRVLIYCDELRKTVRLQFNQQVLTDQTGSSGQNDLRVFFSHALK